MWEKEPKKDMLHDNTVGTGADAGRELINNSAEQRPAGVNCWLSCIALMGQQAGSWLRATSETCRWYRAQSERPGARHWHALEILWSSNGNVNTLTDRHTAAGEPVWLTEDGSSTWAHGNSKDLESVLIWNLVACRKLYFKMLSHTRDARLKDAGHACCTQQE